MDVSFFIKQLKEKKIDTIIGVPDSALKQFCYSMNQGKDISFRHFVPANEGAAVGIAIGHYLATGRPACVYMQNSGLGNTVNPITSLANEKVYGIPILFLIGWRGIPGKKDEPQHRFMGEITCLLLDELEIPYVILRKDTTGEQLLQMMAKAVEQMKKGKQFAFAVEPGTFEAKCGYQPKSIWKLIREDVIHTILSNISVDDIVVSTTGKISREVYEQSDKIYGHHMQAFLTVGGMGHASMIAFGIATEQPNKRVWCIDGDGAALMHMGNLAFLGKQKPKNLIHICLNNDAHESVGGMPTGCVGMDYAKIALESGYPIVKNVQDMDKLKIALQEITKEKQLCFLEVKVALGSREDLGRPKETTMENKALFMEYLRVKKEGWEI